MATDSSTGGVPPDASTLDTQLTDAFGKADAAAAASVQQLQWVHQARASQLSRYAAALKAHYGAKDAGVQSAEASAANAAATAARVAMVQRQLTTPPPKVSAHGWALHGRVYSADGKPQRAFTVFLADAAKAYQQAYGFAYTDETGYFLLQYEPAGKPAAGELFVEVADANARLVHLSDDPFTPADGTATYLDIVLPEGMPTIGKPPAAVRKGTMPKPPPKQ